ncbi:transposase [Streptomyces sp. JNUCC 63]
MTGKGQPRRKGIADPLTEWHGETGTLVPLKISDEERKTVDAVLPDSRRNRTPKREMFEAILWKARTAVRWSEAEVSGNSWSAVGRRAETWARVGSRQGCHGGSEGLWRGSCAAAHGPAAHGGHGQH